MNRNVVAMLTPLPIMQVYSLKCGDAAKAVHVLWDFLATHPTLWRDLVWSIDLASITLATGLIRGVKDGQVD